MRGRACGDSQDRPDGPEHQGAERWGVSEGSGQWPRVHVSLNWEETFVATVLNSSHTGAITLPGAESSFRVISSEAVYSDARLVAAGYILMFCYTILMLGKWNSMEVRLYLSMVGILGIGMGLVIGLSISSVFGFPYTPVHALLPFICLGIGIDDMFRRCNTGFGFQDLPHKSLQCHTTGLLD